MKNTKIQITLVIRPEPGSNDVDGVIFQNTTTANGNTEKWMDDTVGAIKRLVLDHINKGENTLEESKTSDSPPQSAAQDDADEKPEKKEAEEESRDAVKGLMLLRCPACKKDFYQVLQAMGNKSGVQLRRNLVAEPGQHSPL